MGSNKITRDYGNLRMDFDYLFDGNNNFIA
jgi:hypothetical protein